MNMTAPNIWCLIQSKRLSCFALDNLKVLFFLWVTLELNSPEGWKQFRFPICNNHRKRTQAHPLEGAGLIALLKSATGFWYIQRDTRTLTPVPSPRVWSAASTEVMHIPLSTRKTRHLLPVKHFIRHYCECWLLSRLHWGWNETVRARMHS